ncbi:uncharacterized protein V1518DRAFT_424150, partial [Limtongia smithiae]|uniref:uncharacterized protein n=1 Tax=Limtongia smithiae TaxID=1125753 RepID=UPI0034CE6946
MPTSDEESIPDDIIVQRFRVPVNPSAARSRTTEDSARAAATQNSDSAAPRAAVPSFAFPRNPSPSPDPRLRWILAVHPAEVFNDKLRRLQADEASQDGSETSESAADNLLSRDLYVPRSTPLPRPLRPQSSISKHAESAAAALAARKKRNAVTAAQKRFVNSAVYEARYQVGTAVNNVMVDHDYDVHKAAMAVRDDRHRTTPIYPFVSNLGVNDIAKTSERLGLIPSIANIECEPTPVSISVLLRMDILSDYLRARMRNGARNTATPCVGTCRSSRTAAGLSSPMQVFLVD